LLLKKPELLKDETLAQIAEMTGRAIQAELGDTTQKGVRKH
jgi:hypothetical protein